MLVRLILFFLLILFLGRAVWRLLVGVVEGASGTRTGRTGVPRQGARMVRDPVCGTFVVQSRALSADSRGEIAWFCSEDCRRKWRALKG
jgi:YHS domain-containing protein